MHIHRRELLAVSGAVAGASLSGIGWSAVQAPPRGLPPPITAAERLQRLAKARALMQRHGIGAVLIEPGGESRLFHRRALEPL